MTFYLGQNSGYEPYAANALTTEQSPTLHIYFLQRVAARIDCYLAEYRPVRERSLYAHL